MLDSLLLLSFCFLVGLVSLAVCVWVLFSGQMATMDGLLLILLSLLIGGVFMGNFAWSIRKGEFREALNHLQKGSGKSDASGAPPA